MSDIVCIKIAENEKSTYSKFGKLSKHLDIIEILPRKRDKNGNLINRTMGARADRHYLGIKVDMSHLDDVTFSEFREFLRSLLEEDRNESDEGAYPVLDKYGGILKYAIQIGKRKFRADLSKQTFLDETKKTKIEEERLKRSDVALKNSMDMMRVNDFTKVVSFDDFVGMIVSKKDGADLKDFLPAKFKKVV